MEFGRNKIVMIEILIAILGCILVVTVHYFCCKWYMNHFTPRSRGGSLGFAMLYIRYAIIPMIFISAFIKLKYSISILGMAFIFIFYSWYGTNPLRVILMFASLLSGYATIIIAKKHLKETWDNSYPLGSETLSEKKRWRLVLIRDDLDPDKARTIEPGDGWLSLVPVKE